MQNEGRGRWSAAEVGKYLQGIDFPCSKQDLVNHCQTTGCPTELRNFLERLPDQQYFSMASVMQSIGQIE